MIYNFKVLLTKSGMKDRIELKSIFNFCQFDSTDQFNSDWLVG